MPPALIMTVRHEDPRLVVERVATTPAGPVSASFTYATDGVATTNRFKQGADEAEATSTVHWVGSALEFATTIRLREQAVGQKDRWSLSDDRTRLTIARVLTVGGQEVPMTLVLTRRSP